MVRIFMESTWFWMREGFLGFTERVFKAFPLISGFQIPGSDARTPRGLRVGGSKRLLPWSMEPNLERLSGARSFRKQCTCRVKARYKQDKRSIKARIAKYI